MDRTVFHLNRGEKCIGGKLENCKLNEEGREGRVKREKFRMFISLTSHSNKDQPCYRLVHRSWDSSSSLIFKQQGSFCTALSDAAAHECGISALAPSSARENKRGNKGEME